QFSELQPLRIADDPIPVQQAVSARSKPQAQRALRVVEVLVGVPANDRGVFALLEDCVRNHDISALPLGNADPVRMRAPSDADVTAVANAGGALWGCEACVLHRQLELIDATLAAPTHGHPRPFDDGIVGW